MLRWVAEWPVVPERRGNARRGKGSCRTACSARATRLHPRQIEPCPPNSPDSSRAQGKEARLTNVVQYVDEELLRLAFRSLRRQAAPGVDGQSYEEYAANLDQNLKDVH